MFAPTGFTPLATLWSEFREKRSEELYSAACDQYKRTDFEGQIDEEGQLEEFIAGVADEFGSPADLIENVFVKTIRPFTLSLCAPDRDVVSIPSQVADRTSDLFQKLSVLESTVAWDETHKNTEEFYWFARMGSDNFEVWHEKLCLASVWKQHYPGAETPHDVRKLAFNCKYHTLPMCYERHRFAIPTAMPPWSSDPVDEAFVWDTLPKFLGRSICVEDRHAKTWRSKNIRGTDYRGHVKGLLEVETSFGRPRKQEYALTCYDYLYPNGDHPSWKEACRAIERKFRYPVSDRTLRRALAERPKTRQKPRQK